MKQYYHRPTRTLTSPNKQSMMRMKRKPRVVSKQNQQKQKAPISNQGLP